MINRRGTSSGHTYPSGRPTAADRAGSAYSYLSRFFNRCPRNWTEHNQDVEKWLRLARLVILETKRPARRRGASAESGPDTSAVGLFYRLVRERTDKRYSDTQRSRRRAHERQLYPYTGRPCAITSLQNIVIIIIIDYYHSEQRKLDPSNQSSRGVYFDRQNDSWSGDTNKVPALNFVKFLIFFCFPLIVRHRQRTFFYRQHKFTI